MKNQSLKKILFSLSTMATAATTAAMVVACTDPKSEPSRLTFINIKDGKGQDFDNNTTVSKVRIARENSYYSSRKFTLVLQKEGAEETFTHTFFFFATQSEAVLKLEGLSQGNWTIKSLKELMGDKDFASSFKKFVLEVKVDPNAPVVTEPTLEQPQTPPTTEQPGEKQGEQETPKTSENGKNTTDQDSAGGNQDPKAGDQTEESKDPANKDAQTEPKDSAATKTSNPNNETEEQPASTSETDEAPASKGAASENDASSNPQPGGEAPAQGESAQPTSQPEKTEESQPASADSAETENSSADSSSTSGGSNESESTGSTTTNAGN